MTGNPYVGPRSIADAEHPGERIWGRDREMSEVADLLIAERIVLVYSPSGAGKTSLLQAGVIPLLRERRFRALPSIRVGAEVPPGIELRAPENRYTLSVLLSLEEALPKERKTPVERLARMTLAEYLGEDAVRELFLFDQFEEVLTADPLDVEGREAFFQQLGDALRLRGRWAIFAIREDYLGPLDRYVKHLPTRLSHTYRLNLLAKEAALESITGPASAQGVSFSREAAWTLVENLSALVVDYEGAQRSGLGEYVEPVQLQVVCRRLWDNLDEGTTIINAGHIGDLQSVDQALGDYYADTVRNAAKASGVAEQAIRGWFGRSLITAQKTRRQVSQSDEATAPVLAALEPLRDAYLIRADRRVGQIWYELAHDRLIRPVLQNNDAHTPELQRRAELWDVQGRRDALLLNTRDYQRLNAQRAGATPVGVEFLDRSRRRRALRFGMWALAAAVAFGIVATVVLAVQTRRASRQLDQDRIELAATRADVEQKKGDLAREKADHKKTDDNLQETRTAAQATLAALNVNIHLAASNTLAVEATARREGRFDLAALLGVEAWKQAHTFEARAALFSLARANPRLRTTLHPDTIVNAVAFGPQGSLAMAGNDGSVWIWDIGRRVPVKTARGTSPITAVSVSRDGLIVSGDGAGNLRLWDGKNGAAISPPVKAHQKDIGSVNFEAGGRLLISGSSDGAVRFWAVQDRKLVPAVKERDGVPASQELPLEVASAAFSLATREAVVLVRDGMTFRWSLDQPQAPQVWGRRVVDAGMLGSGKVFGAESDDGVYLFDNASVARAFRTFDAVSSGPLSAATVSSDGKVVAVGAQGRTIHVSDVKTSGKLDPSWVRLKGPSDECRLLALTPDGSMLASVGFSDTTVWIWDLRRQLPSLAEPVTADTFPAPIELNQSAVLDAKGQSLLTTFGQQGETLVSLTRSDNGWKHIATIRQRNTDGARRPTLALGENGGRPFAVIGELKPPISIRSRDLSREYSTISADVLERLALSHDGKLLAVLGYWKPDGRRFQLYSLADLSHPIPISIPHFIEPPDRDDLQVSAIAFSPARNLLVLGGARLIGGVPGEDAINLWDLQNPAQARLAGMLTQGAAEASVVAFSPDGKLLATAASDIKLWDVPPPGVPARQIYPRATVPLPFEPSRIAFSPDGGLLAVSHGGPQVVLLETMRGAMLGEPIDLGHPVDILGFEADGEGLLLWSGRGIERIPMKPDQWVRNLCARANRNLSLPEWKMFLAESIDYDSTCPNLPAGEGVGSESGGKPR